MIIVDEKKCTACGLCVRICHEQCITLIQENGNKATLVNHDLCSNCTQCIAICPQQALSWDQVPSAVHDKSLLPSAEQLEEFLKQRRTIRRFKAKKINRALVQEIVAYGIYAPTNNYKLKAIVVDDPAIIEVLDAVIIKYVKWFYKLVYRSRFVTRILQWITPEVDRKNQVKIARGLAMGRTYKTIPAAQVYIVGDRRIVLSEVNAHYALYNMILMAQAKGIGSCIKAAGSLILDRTKTARNILGLKKREHILATLDLGYPAVRFKNKVEGKCMPIEWVGGAVNVN